MLSTRLPLYPWERIATDLLELNGFTYLIVVDYYSRFIEVLTLTTSSSVIIHLKPIFARFGIQWFLIMDLKF